MVRAARRIAIIGPSGSGKSTLARRLGPILDLPVIHLDRLYWKAGWVESNPEDFERVQSEAVSASDWIIDGNYSRTFDNRLPASDVIIWLDFPRRIYFRRAITRIVRWFGRTRPDLADGCREHFDAEFLRFVWRIPKDSRPRTERYLEESGFGRKLIHLHHPRQLARLLGRLDQVVSPTPTSPS